MCLISIARTDYKNILTTKISGFTVVLVVWFHQTKVKVRVQKFLINVQPIGGSINLTWFHLWLCTVEILLQDGESADECSNWCGQFAHCVWDKTWLPLQQVSEWYLCLRIIIVPSSVFVRFCSLLHVIAVTFSILGSIVDWIIWDRYKSK